MRDHSICNEKIISSQENEIVLELAIPSECDFFDGHFDEFKLLPAVGQFEIITRFAAKYFGLKKSVSSIKRIKFSAPVLPDAQVILAMKYIAQKNTVSFVFSDSADTEKVYSTGSFQVEKNE